MAHKKRVKRRQSHGSAWHWKQTDCWYYTLPGTKKRISLFDENGERIRGVENKQSAEIALAKEKVAWSTEAHDSTGPVNWIVARACSEYIQHCERNRDKGVMTAGYTDNVRVWLNDFCAYCGALPIAQLKKGHVSKWIESHEGWKSPATQSTVIAVVQAAFNRVEEHFGIPNPLKGLKRPKAQPRLTSISPDDEEILYENTEVCFRNFLFVGIHTGLRPFCELAKLTQEHVEETERGMMWRVCSTKNKKTRKIPVHPEVATLTRKLIKQLPANSTLPVFRNTKGDPWKNTAGVVRFIALREKLGWQSDPVRSNYSCYTCRHTFAHRMLSGYWNNGVGCSIETLAELMGDTPKVAYDHYGKEWAQNYQDPLWAAIGEPPQKQSRQRKRKKAG